MDSRTRAIWILLLLACGFTVISYNLIQIQLVEHLKYTDLARANHSRVETIPPIRGTIYAADGSVLAQTQRVYDVHLDGKMEGDPAHLRAIAAALGEPVSKITEIYSAKNRAILLATGLSVDDPALAQIRNLKDNLKYRALIVDSRDERTYPNAELAAHVLGYIDDATGHGMAGMEKDLDKLLVGEPGKRYVALDAKRQEIAAYGLPEEPAVDGDNVTLTIRLAVQHVVDEKLDEIVDKYSPAAAYIIVMDPHSGEILGMGSRPTYDPNDRKTFAAAAVRNRCITDVAEPGSIFKIITLSAALNEGLVTLDTPINCENGEWTFAGRALHDDEREGVLPVIEVLAKSSNIGFAKLGANYLGPQRLYKYARDFGIGERTDLFGGQGETPGLLQPVSKWSGLSVSRIPIGQEVAVSPIQMVTAMSVIANGGRLIEPHLTKTVTDAENNVLQIVKPDVVRQVISRRTADEVTKALEQVTIDGTAKAIKIPGYNYAGKTGTAQKFVDGAYSHTQHVSSFLGFLPVEDPAFVALVMVDSPHTKAHEDYGAQVSGPVFANLASQVAQIMTLTPDQPVTLPPSVPTLTSSADTKTKWTP
jgi:cell division protein FtsI/penicillin-binding protein 2